MIGNQQQDFSHMDDRTLQQAIVFAQRSNNTPTFLALTAEAQKRQKMRSAAQGQQAAQQPTTVADQVMQGIARLTAPSVDEMDAPQYASGGIVAFAGGGVSDDERRAADREAMLDTLRKLKAAGIDIATLPGRALAGASESAITRPLRALGVDVPYLPESFYGGDRTSMTPYMDALSKGKEPAIAPADQATKLRAMDNAMMSAPQATQGQPPAPSAPAVPAPAPAPRAQTSQSTQQTSSVPAQAQAAVQAGVMSREEYRKAMDAYSEGDNKALDAIFAKSIARDAKRREELEGQNKDTKGFLGIDVSGDTRAAIRDAGIALLRSKKPYLDIGEGIATGFEGYEKRKTDRTTKLEALDKAQEVRDLAMLAAKQGNRKEAAALMSQYDGYMDKINDNARQDRALQQQGEYQNRSLGIQERQAGSQAAVNNARIKSMQEGRSQADVARKEYASLWNRISSEVAKDDSLTTEAARQAAIATRMRYALMQNPWMAQYAGNVGFSSQPTGKTYSLTDD